MVDVSRIIEIKNNGVDTAKPEDMVSFFNIVSEYLNTNADAQNVLGGADLSVSLDIDNVGSQLNIKGGKAEFKNEKLVSADVSLFTDLKTMAGIATGLLDAQKAFLSGALEVDGDFEKMIDFIEILENAFEKLGIATADERDVLVDAATMRKLIELYNAGGADIDKADIPMFFNIFCAFINLNGEAQDVIEDENLRVQMIVKEAGPYLIYKDEEGKLKWSSEKVDDAILEFEVSIQTAADVLLGGDAASAYLSGEVTATGNIAQALILQELLELFLEILPFS